jgi:predicted site-specific integrase-resolvase
MIINDDQLYTLVEISDLTGWSTKTIRRRMDKGIIKRVTAKREKVKFWGKDIKKWLKMEI